MLTQIKSQIQEYTGLFFCKTTLSLFSDSEEIACFDTSLSEKCGFFVPRELKGFVRSDPDPSETKRRAIHEASHGLYLENTSQGQIIVENDKKVAESEQEVFSRILKRNEKVLAITDMDNRGFVPVAKLDDVTKKEINARNIPLENYNVVAFCEKGAFLHYKALREAYSKLIECDLETQEGFCVFMEEAILRRMGNPIAQQILLKNSESDDIYGRGFRKMKVLEEYHGLEGILGYIKGGKICIGQRQ